MQRLEGLLGTRHHDLRAIDHSGEAAKVGLTMRPTKLLIFGSPKGGTPLMQAAPSVAIDLPLKALFWQDADGKVWLTYNDPAYLAAASQFSGGAASQYCRRERAVRQSGGVASRKKLRSLSSRAGDVVVLRGVADEAVEVDHDAFSSTAGVSITPACSIVNRRCSPYSSCDCSRPPPRRR